MRNKFSQKQQQQKTFYSSAGSKKNFSISPLHVRWRLSYIIKDEDDSSEGLYNCLTNDGLILNQWKN